MSTTSTLAALTGAAGRALTHTGEREPDADSVFADLPQATLGALVLVSAIGLIQIERLREIGHIHRQGVVPGLLTLLGVLQGVPIGALASMLLLVHALNHPHIDRLEDGAT